MQQAGPPQGHTWVQAAVSLLGGLGLQMLAALVSVAAGLALARSRRAAIVTRARVAADGCARGVEL